MGRDEPQLQQWEKTLFTTSSQLALGGSLAVAIETCVFHGQFGHFTVTMARSENSLPSGRERAPSSSLPLLQLGHTSPTKVDGAVKSRYNSLAMSSAIVFINLLLWVVPLVYTRKTRNVSSTCVCAPRDPHHHKSYH